MSTREDRLIHWLLGSLELDTTLFHLGQYCGAWKASISGLARSGFHLLLQGNCWLHLPEQGLAIPLQRGDAVFFLRDVPHYLSPLADPQQAASLPRAEMTPVDFSIPEGVALACGFFEFRSDLNQVFLGSFPDYLVIPADGSQLAEIRPVFELLLNEVRNSPEAPSSLITRLVDLMFFYVIRHLCRQREVSSGLWAILAQPEFAPLLQAIIDAPGREWTVEDMAQLAHMSRATFFKRFDQVCGVSPSHFLLQIRMKVASRLIQEGTSLARTAEQVGYQSDAAFSRAFKKATGVLPGAYRRACQPMAA